MLDRTKKHRTDMTELTFRGPEKNKEKAIRALFKLGFTETSDSIPWRDAFPGFDENNLPGVNLRAARQRESLTQIELSKRTGVPQRHISEMENGKRPIGKKNDQIFSEALGIGYRVFL